MSFQLTEAQKEILIAAAEGDESKVVELAEQSPVDFEILQGFIFEIRDSIERSIPTASEALITQRAFKEMDESNARYKALLVNSSDTDTSKIDRSIAERVRAGVEKLRD